MPNVAIMFNALNNPVAVPFWYRIFNKISTLRINGQSRTQDIVSLLDTETKSLAVLISRKEKMPWVRGC